MKIDKSKKILIVGLGLLGGSYARALKRFGFPISAITKERSDIDYAIREQIIDEGSTELDEKMIGEADLVIFALYPHVFVEWIEKNQKLLKKGAIITDVTGVKVSIVYKIQEILRDDVEFIAAHPMAGREVSGVENSTDKMFQGANYIVTPTEKNTPGAISTCLELGRLLLGSLHDGGSLLLGLSHKCGSLLLGLAHKALGLLLALRKALRIELLGELLQFLILHF